jgi:hypothetical protein
MAARMVLYRYDFHDEATEKASQLNSHGRRRLNDILRMADSHQLYPVIIESTAGDSDLDTARRDHVLEIIGQSTFAVPEDWVVVGEPRAAGISGDEALGIDQEFLNSVKAGQQVTETSILGGLMTTKSHQEPASR